MQSTSTEQVKSAIDAAYKALALAQALAPSATPLADAILTGAGYAPSPPPPPLTVISIEREPQPDEKLSSSQIAKVTDVLCGIAQHGLPNLLEIARITLTKELLKLNRLS